MTESRHEVFIAGETVDLVFPSERAIDDGWHRWFNDPKTTRWLDQGAYPNTRENQRRFLEEMMSDNSDRLALMVKPKHSEKVTGIVSLSGINGKNKSGHVALVIGDRSTSRDIIFHSLEAKALITEHAFENMGLERVWGNQAVELERWQRYQVLFGFRPEGILRNAFRKGHKVSNTVITSCLLCEYLKIKENRGGCYWPGKNNLLELMRMVPEVSIVEAVQTAIQTEVDAYLSSISDSKRI